MNVHRRIKQDSTTVRCLAHGHSAVMHGCSPVTREVLRISIICSGRSLLPNHGTAADGGRDMAIHHNDIVIVVVDVVTPDIKCRIPAHICVRVSTQVPLIWAPLAW